MRHGTDGRASSSGDPAGRASAGTDVATTASSAVHAGITTDRVVVPDLVRTTAGA